MRPGSSTSPTRTSSSGTVEPTLVAHGIKVSLLTTAGGLIVAVPINITYNFFVTRIDQLIMDMEQGAQKILNLAWDFEQKGRLEVVRPEPAEFPVY